MEGVGGSGGDGGWARCSTTRRAASPSYQAAQAVVAQGPKLDSYWLQPLNWRMGLVRQGTYCMYPSGTAICCSDA